MHAYPDILIYQIIPSFHFEHLFLLTNGMQGASNRRISPSWRLGSFNLSDKGKHGPKANKMKEYDDRYVGSREPQTPEIEQKSSFRQSKPSPDPGTH